MKVVKFKRAFTFIELVIIIVVIGILSATIIPRISSSPLEEVTAQIASDLAYAQHLALISDDYDVEDENWFKKRWMLEFSETTYDGEKSLRYSVYRDLDLSGNLNSINEVAKMPGEGNDRYMTAHFASSATAADRKKLNRNMDIEKRFGIKEVKFEGRECSKDRNKAIAFDNTGIPLRKVSTSGGGGAKNPGDRYLTGDCNITLTHKNGGKGVITVTAEAGAISWEVEK